MTIDRKDLGAGAAFIAAGLIYGSIALYGGLGNPRLPLGRALSMGPGMFPVILSGLVIAVGLILVVRSFFAAKATNFFGVISWRAIIMVSLAVILFGTFLREMGLALAIWLTTFLAALGSKHARPLYAAVVSLGIAAFCVIIFGYVARLPIPLIGTWFTG